MWRRLLILILLGVTVLFRCTDSVDLPRFVGPGSNVTVAVGRDAALTCRVDDLQSFKVAWLRVDTQTILTIAGHVITKNHRISVQHGDGAWTLGLRDVSATDGGRYMCQVNTEPMMSQTHLLQVVVPPDIDDEASSGEVLVKEGESATLRCVASGVPLPNITWRREDSRHFKIDNQTLVSKHSGEWLNITGVERVTSGAYLCIATNGVPPSVSKRIQINVMFAPSVWAGRVAIRALSGSSVTLTCTAEAYPLPQTYWILNGEQRLINGSKYRLSKTSRGYRHTLTLQVADMSREDAGSYRCHVENSLGKAQAELFLHMLTTTTTTTTTTTSTTTTTTTPPPTTTMQPYDAEMHLEQLHRGVLEDPALENSYIVLSQHQMQNLEMVTTM
ncbi:lachesin-like [Maniola jurtina]|uniref:lachesin-like n=1 Tax=Maniola jurtina TaxID=191418 RepID=UPI001E68A277|nr:lachesin-like [Maniola jurtina]